MIRLIERLTILHIAISRALFVAAGLSLVVFTSVFNLEVGRRYLLNAPSTWAQDVVSIAALATTFLALPYVTLKQKHVRIDFVTEKFGTEARHRLHMLQFVASALVLFLIAGITFSATLKQFGLSVQTASSIAIPKWPMLAIMSWAFLSAALHLAALVFGKAPAE